MAWRRWASLVHLEKRLAHWAKPRPQVTDVLACPPMEPNATSLPRLLTSRRYERRSMLQTSNRGVCEWGKVLGDSVVATVFLGRLLNHIRGITNCVESCRLRIAKRSDPYKPPSGKGSE